MVSSLRLSCRFLSTVFFFFFVTAFHGCVIFVDASLYMFLVISDFLDMFMGIT
jgi:hypothetical protein